MRKPDKPAVCPYKKGMIVLMKQGGKRKDFGGQGLDTPCRD
jgi:hypothetical protein